jgi:hypothetical protein
MADRPEASTDLLRLALEGYREEYRDLSETWRNLDGKAQGSGAIAGIFLAAVFAWVRPLAAGVGTVEKVFFCASIVLLVASVVAAVLALQVRTVSAPPLGDETGQMINDLLRPENADELPERVPRLFKDQIRAWRDTNRDMAEVNLGKANRVRDSQVTLLAAAAVVAALSVMAVLGVLGR